MLLNFCQVREDNPDLHRLLNCLLNFFLQAHAIVAAACEIQSCINRLLGRAESTTEFTAHLIDIHNLLQGEEARKLPFILNELETVLKIEILITPNKLNIYPR